MAATPSAHLILSEPEGVHQCQGRLQQFQLHILLMELFHLQVSRQSGCTSGKHVGGVGWQTISTADSPQRQQSQQVAACPASNQK